MTTTDLIKILKDTEYGGISHKPRNISLTINGKYMPDPRITLSSTGDGIAGPEIDLDIDGEFFEEQQPCEDEYIKVPKKALKYRTVGMVAYNVEWLKNHFDIERAVICGSQETCVDAISRQSVLEVIEREQFKGDAISEIEKLQPVQPKYNPDEWCHNCSEYDHDKHCCPRYNGVIRKTVEEIKQPKVGHWIYDEILIKHYYCSECKSMGVDYWDYCPNCGAKMESEDKE